MNTCAPIVLFVYNRPDHTCTCLEYLERNELAAESELYIFADGAKPGSESSVAAVRQVIARPWKFRRVTVVERPENRGLAANVIDGVSTLLEQYDRVIVLEDDLVVAPYFLRFMNDALELYRDEPRVGHIQACDFTHDRSLPDIFLIKFTGSWGWGTWRRAWRYFNPDGAALLRALEQDKRLSEPHLRFQREISLYPHVAPAGRGEEQFVGHSLECFALLERYPVVECGAIAGPQHRVRR